MIELPQKFALIRDDRIGYQIGNQIYKIAYLPPAKRTITVQQWSDPQKEHNFTINFPYTIFTQSLEEETFIFRCFLSDEPPEPDKPFYPTPLPNINILGFVCLGDLSYEEINKNIESFWNSRFIIPWEATSIIIANAYGLYRPILNPELEEELALQGLKCVENDPDFLKTTKKHLLKLVPKVIT